jgi:hypothetical protein
MIMIDQAKHDQWRGIIEQHVASGLSASEFCELENIKRKQFYAWRSRLAQNDLESVEADFIPMEFSATSEQHPRSNNNISIKLGLVEIGLPSNFESADLARAMGVLYKYAKY